MLNMKVLGYRITSNENSVGVYREYTSEKTGDLVSALVGHYPTLDMALRGVQKHYTLAEGTEIRTIEDYRKALAEVQEAFEVEINL